MILLFIPDAATAQTNAPSAQSYVIEENALSLQLKTAATPLRKVQSLLALAAFYRTKNTESAIDLSKAINASKHAQDLSGRIKYNEGMYNATVELAATYIKWRKMKELEMLFQESRDSSKAEIARLLSQAYNNHRDQRVYDFNKSIAYAQASITESARIKNRQRHINGCNQLGYVYWMHNKFDSAEEQFLEVLKLGKNAKFQNVEFAYATLIRIYEGKGYLNLAIKYGLEAFDYVAFSGNRHYVAHVYEILARVYKIIGEPEKSIQFFEAGCAEAIIMNHPELYWLQKAGITESLLSVGRSKEAKRIIRESAATYPPLGKGALGNYYLALGQIHTALGEYDSANTYLQKAMSIAERKNDKVAVYRGLAELNFAWKKYDECKILTDKIISDPRHFSLTTIAYIRMLAYRADSALGNLHSAIEHLLVHKRMTDSLNAITRVRQMQELAILHETEKVKQDVRLKQQSILLLERQKQLQSKDFEQARLRFLIDRKDQENRLLRFSSEAARKDRDLLVNQKSIEQLRSENESRRRNLSTANLIKNITLAFIILLTAFLIMLYRQYRSKKKSEKIISSKNEALERLLAEKVWLLKEVHHRVKNNLQTVVSLLESQSVYLENEALEANQNSRNRIYAMSLVHKKLYQSENVSSIPMDNYLSELICHLRESLDLDQQIRFTQELDPLQLDVSQAISLGLILNEAITNAIKHAFINHDQAKSIAVTMQVLPGQSIELTISDNGTGLPENFNSARPLSLGLKLMKGLSEDIEGSFSIGSSNQGTRVIISFHPKTPLVPAQQLS